jgi:predicted Zn-dependent peptidase
MLMDSPQEWVDVLLDEVMWGDQPLGWDIAGTRDSVLAITRADMLQYVQTHYVPGHAVLSIAGAVDHEQTVAKVANALGEWQPSPMRTWRTALDSPQLRLKVQNKRTEQAHLCIGTAGVSYVDPDRFALDLLNVVLGEGMSSRLFQEIREKRGLAYDVHSFVNHYRDVGSCIVYAGVDPRRVLPALEAIIEELERLKEPVPAVELAKAKEFWKGRMLLRMEDTRSISSWMGGQELLLGRIMDVDEVVDIIDALTVDDLQQVAHKLIVPEALRLAVIGPFSSSAKFSRLLGA